MPVPKTNLFKGDRVKFSQSYLRSQPGLPRRSRERVGTIVNDTLSVRAEYIKVCWDGNADAHRKDYFLPNDLVLYEEEFETVGDSQ